VTRWAQKTTVEEVLAQFDHASEEMRIRQHAVEHPFGTIKAWMGVTHFLTRIIKRVDTEMGLHVLPYNMKRVIKHPGSEQLIVAFHFFHMTSGWAQRIRSREHTFLP
jgi:transposase